jgi:hypothetical protein
VLSRRRAPGVVVRARRIWRRAGVVAWRCLLVLRAPQAETFDLLRPAARWRETLGLLAAMGAATGMLYQLHRPLVLGLPRALLEGALVGTRVRMGVFCVVAGGLAGLMRLLGGRGAFREFCGLVALGGAPLVALATAGSLVPVVGGAINAALALYAVLLAALAAASAYRLPLWRAVLGVLLGLGVLAVASLAAAAGVVLVVLKSVS